MDVLICMHNIYNILSKHLRIQNVSYLGLHRFIYLNSAFGVELFDEASFSFKGGK